MICNDPLLRKHFSLLFLQATPSSPSWTLEGIFEPTPSCSRALNHLVRCVQTTEIQGQCPVCRTGGRSPHSGRTLSRTTDTETYLCVCRKRTCFGCSKYWVPGPLAPPPFTPLDCSVIHSRPAICEDRNIWQKCML